MSPQQNVPEMQQSGVHGLAVVEPDSCWKSVGPACPVDTEPLVPAAPRKLPSVTTLSEEFESEVVSGAGMASRLAQTFAPFKQQPSGTGTQEVYGRTPSVSQNVPQQNCPVGQQSGLQERLASPA